MNSRAKSAIAGALLMACFLVAGLLIGLVIGANDDSPGPEKTVTVEKTVPGPERTVTKEKTVPGPETTVEKTVKEPCVLPDTGGQDGE